MRAANREGTWVPWSARHADRRERSNPSRMGWSQWEKKARERQRRERPEAVDDNRPEDQLWSRSWPSVGFRRRARQPE